MSDPQQIVDLWLTQQEIDFILSSLERTEPTNAFPEHAELIATIREEIQRAREQHRLPPDVPLES